MVGFPVVVHVTHNYNVLTFVNVYLFQLPEQEGSHAVAPSLRNATSWLLPTVWQGVIFEGILCEHIAVLAC